MADTNEEREIDEDWREEKALRLKEGNFLFGLARKEKIKRSGKKPLVQVRFYWKRVFLFVSIAGLVAWMATAATLYFYFKNYRDYEEASFFKMLILPFTLEEHRREMGEFFIEKGMAEIEAGDVRSGFHHLRIGLARSPANAEARLTVAKIFWTGFKVPRLAIQTMTEGLRFSDQQPGFMELDYLGLLFQILVEEEKDRQRIEIVEQVLEDAPSSTIRGFLQLQAASAEVELGEFQEAFNRLKNSSLDKTPQGKMLIARGLINSGRSRMAVVVLESAVEQFPQIPQLTDAFYTLLIEEERWDVILSQMRFRRFTQTDNLLSYIAELHALGALGKEVEIVERVEELLRKFPTREAQSKVLGYAVKTRQSEVADLILNQIQEEDEPETGLILSCAFAFVVDDRADEGLALMDSIPEKEDPVLAGRIAILRGLAYEILGQSELALPLYRRFLEGPPDVASFYLLMEGIFSSLDMDIMAEKILRKAVKVYPENRMILTKIIPYEKDQPMVNSYMEHATALMEERLPTFEVMEEIRGVVVRDRFLFHPGQTALVEKIEDVLAQDKFLDSAIAVPSRASIDWESLDNKPQREFMRLQ